MLVFISYSTHDKDFVNDICTYLKRLNIDYWIDEHKIKGGQDWQDSIRKILPRIDVVLFCVSDAALKSDNVKWELEQARLHHKKILPVKVGPCEATIPGMENISFIELYEQKSLLSALNKLADSLRNYDQDTHRERPPRIFINYRQGADSNDQELAEYLNDELTKQGADVWLDIFELGQGASWGQTIKHGIDTCDWMLLIVSPTSMRSRRVDAIWREFINQGKEDNLILIISSHTPINFKLHRCPYADFSEDRSDGWKQLMTLRNSRDMKLLPYIPDEKLPEPNQPLDWHKDHGALYLISPQTIQPRHKFTKPEAMIDKARQEIWVSSISMTKVAQCDFVPFLNSAAARVSLRPLVRFLLLDPDEQLVLEEASAYLGVEASDLKTRILFSLGLLKQFKAQALVADQVEIRVTRHRPSSGYLIIDPEHDETGAMTVAPYLHHIDNAKMYRTGKSKNDLESPFIYLTRLSERQSFEVFCEDFKRAWEKARLWPDGPYPLNPVIE